VHNKGVPYISKVAFSAIIDDATAISDLLASGIDVAAVPGTQLSRVQGNPSIKLHPGAYNALMYVSFNVTHPPFNNAQVRKAVAELINRPDVVKAAFGGQAVAVYDSLPPGATFFDKNLKKDVPAYNPSDAAKLIAANHATGPYTLLLRVRPYEQVFAEILQAAAAQAGMTLNIKLIDTPTYISLAAKGQFDVNILTFQSNDADVLWNFLDSSQGHGAGLNFTGVADSTLDTLLQKGRTTLAYKKAAQFYQQAQTLIDKQAYLIGVASPRIVTAYRANIKGYHANGVGTVAIQDLYLKTK
jgi:peptide/nickel transport system substrate-binding protein